MSCLRLILGDQLNPTHSWFQRVQPDVLYLAIDDPRNLHDIPANLMQLAQAEQLQAIEYQAPDEYRLDQQLQQFAQQASLPVRMVSSEHFYTERMDVAKLLEGKKQWLMERFYQFHRKTSSFRSRI